MSYRWVLLGSLRSLTSPLLRFAGAGVITSVILFSLTRSGVFWRVSILAANGRQTFYGQLTFCTRRKGLPLLVLIVLLLLRLRIRIHSITFLRTLSTKGTAHKASKFRPNEQALPSDGNPPTLFSFIRNCSPGHSIRPSLSPHTCSKPSSRRSQDSDGHAVSTPSKCPASIKTDSPMTSPPTFHTLHGGQGVVIS